MSSFLFDASKVEPQESFEPIPAGTYIAVIEESEVKTTKAGNGQYLKLRWKILDGQYKGRVLFGNLNVSNTNAEAERIGQRQLSALCHAVGVLQLQDTQQLHAKPVKIKVKIRTDETGKYGDQNEITAYESAGATAAFAVPAAAPSAPAAPAAPWARRAA